MAARSVGTNDPALTGQLEFARPSPSPIFERYSGRRPAQQAEYAAKLAQFQQALLDDLRDTFQLLQRQDDTAPPRVEDLPPALHHQFVGMNGKFLIQVYPKEDVWQREPQEKFVKELRTVDPNVTGTPVQL